MYLSEGEKQVAYEKGARNVDVSVREGGSD